MHPKFILVALLLVFSCNKKSPSSQNIECQELQILLDKAKVNGAILIFDSNKNMYYASNFEEAKKGTIPASTYKIPHTIIGLETGELEDEKTIFVWDGKKRAFSIWEKDMSLKEAFQKSCVPCYQELARKIGAKRMNENLARLHFGEMHVTEETIADFWLTGESKINTFQQIDFLKRLNNKELPISDSTCKIIRNVLIIEKNEDFTLSGKTGLVIKSGKKVGWFVGYLEKGDHIFYFASRITPKVDMAMTEFSLLRKTITRSAFRKLGVLEY
ncbi:MAG: class D beta-lactamase [Bacteroidetes bacterium]|nr:MAG: class D beta-lactamase [Bacteroidota bacterium]